MVLITTDTLLSQINKPHFGNFSVFFFFNYAFCLHSSADLKILILDELCLIN